MPRRSARRCGFDVAGCNTYMVRHVPRHWQRRRTRFQRRDVAYYDRKGKKEKRAAHQQFSWLSKSHPGHVFTHKKSKKSNRRKGSDDESAWPRRFSDPENSRIMIMRCTLKQNAKLQAQGSPTRDRVQVVGRSQNVIAVFWSLLADRALRIFRRSRRSAVCSDCVSHDLWGHERSAAAAVCVRFRCAVSHVPTGSARHVRGRVRQLLSYRKRNMTSSFCKPKIPPHGMFDHPFWGLLGGETNFWEKWTAPKPR